MLLMQIANLDPLGPVRVLEGVVGVVERQRRRRHVGDHDGAAVAADGVLEEPRQLRVAVGDVSEGGRRVNQ